MISSVDVDTAGAGFPVISISSHHTLRARLQQSSIWFLLAGDRLLRSSPLKTRHDRLRKRSWPCVVTVDISGDQPVSGLLGPRKAIRAYFGVFVFVCVTLFVLKMSSARTIRKRRLEHQTPTPSKYKGPFVQDLRWDHKA